VLLFVGLGSLAVADDARPKEKRLAPVSEPHVEPGGGGGVVPLNLRKKSVLNTGKVISSTSGRP
jgi:hypothetical protein